MSKKQQSIIEVKDLHKSYKNDGLSYHVLKGVNMSIKRGEYVSIMGPSGSGKSTLLHILGLFDKFDSGNYFLDGIDVNHLSETEKAKVRALKIGFVFQMFYLIPSLTVLENIILPGLIVNRPRNELIEKAKHIAEKFGILEILEKTPNKVSGGQMQRSAIARALINDPAVILADEPTGNLDSKSGKAVLDLFDELHKEGRTIVMITHDSNVAKRAQRTLYIFDGFISEKPYHKSD
ncbi:MAG: ABC transporter ATP-binding protein [Candidatus Micrarchaeota archaeon]|nr:ABC transporter ATP-binding protein [Candidatus Micrarchaeota archaeon]